MLFQILLLLLGLALIIKCADILVDASSKLARRYGVSTFIIGITVIAFGTSAPELAVGIISGINHANQLTLGDVLGSSIANMGLIAGVAALIFPLQVKDIAVRRELPILFAVQSVLCVMTLSDGWLSRLDGIILVAVFVLYMLYIALDHRKSATIQIDAEGDIYTDGDGNNVPKEAGNGNKHTVPRLWLFSVLSLAGLFLGGKLTVDSSTAIAESIGLSQTLIGLTVIALATSMPELITSIVAARKKEPDIVLGNCIGSNILNILLVLGLSAIISPISTGSQLLFDFASILTLTAFVLIISALRKKLRRLTGIILVACYITYIIIKLVTTLG